MASQRMKNAAGYGFFGLGIGVILFSVVYFITNRWRFSEVQSYTWLGLYLAALLGPAILLSLWGSSRADERPGA